MLRSLTLTHFTGDLHMLLHQISQFSLSINSLHIRSSTRISADGFRVLGKKMKTLKSLTCSSVASPTVADLLLISECLPFLEELEIGSFRLRYSNKGRLI
ncbi:hypothetical protein TanjilG_02182 [Lupinus angustifolius]|uniref:Uncharacterized protein n=1 Tax=Lupinus angustifolius TaxID=3871 RepID=A0A1J7HGJ4_LUPAN|nr:hypothetical protein TanjilG_02182 [Lupinus angustifolius]